MSPRGSTLHWLVGNDLYGGLSLWWTSCPLVCSLACFAILRVLVLVDFAGSSCSAHPFTSFPVSSQPRGAPPTSYRVPWVLGKWASDSPVGDQRREESRVGAGILPVRLSGASWKSSEFSVPPKTHPAGCTRLILDLGMVTAPGLSVPLMLFSL